MPPKDDCYGHLQRLFPLRIARYCAVTGTETQQQFLGFTDFFAGIVARTHAQTRRMRISAREES